VNNKFVSLVAVVSLVLTGNALNASNLLPEHDTTLVRQQFNFLDRFDFKGKKVAIFGCGHGNHNDRGRENDQGNHAHEGAICFDISNKSKADYVLDVTKPGIPEHLIGTVDVVYLEYLTPESIYRTNTFTNALKLLKADGILMWDVYWSIRAFGAHEKSACLNYCKMQVGQTEIGFLNTDPRKIFKGIFKLRQDDQILPQYFSYGNNPFNERKNSQIMHVSVADLDQERLKAFIQATPLKVLPMIGNPVINEQDFADGPSIDEQIEQAIALSLKEERLSKAQKPGNDLMAKLYAEVKRTNQNSLEQFGFQTELDVLISEMNLDETSPCFGYGNELLEYHKKLSK
jgi:hypothetical protein